MSAERTGQMIKQVTHLALPNVSPDQLRRLNFVVRKSAHLAEYAGLAALTGLAIMAGFPSTQRGSWFILALSLASIVAISDEFHQSLVPNRTGAVRDVVIDACGALLALVAIAVCRWRRSRKPESTASLI